MITLDTGNVLLKPSQRRQLMHWLRRVFRLGKSVADFALHLTLRRNGRCTEITATMRDRAGRFACKRRSCDWRDAARELIRTLAVRLATQRDLGVVG